MPRRDTPIVVYLNKDEEELLNKRVEQEARTVSGHIRWLILKDAHQPGPVNPILNERVDTP